MIMCALTYGQGSCAHRLIVVDDSIGDIEAANCQCAAFFHRYRYRLSRVFIFNPCESWDIFCRNGTALGL